MEPTDTPDTPDTPDIPEVDAVPAPPPPPTAAEQLDAGDAAQLLAELDPMPLTTLTTDAVRAARSDPSLAWLVRLDRLRLGLMLRNQRPLLALCQKARFDVAMASAQPAVAAESARTLWGVREMMGEPWKAHKAMLMLAQAQEAAEQPGAAEMTLMKAIQAAQALAPAGNVIPASAAAARTLTQLGQLLARQGRPAEAVEWLQGALDVAPDEETAAPARAALGRVSPA